MVHLTNQDVLSRAADLLEDAGWSPDAAPRMGPPYNTFRAIEAAALLLRDEAPGNGPVSPLRARMELRERLRVPSLHDWERRLTQPQIVAALRGQEAQA